MKTIQEQNREFIIMANNPEAKTYEEALEMELGFGCIIQTDIIGKPLTLNRVLIAFKSVYLDKYKNIISLRRDKYEDYIDWDLTKETLEEQSEEVQIAINEMIK